MSYSNHRGNVRTNALLVSKKISSYGNIEECLDLEQKSSEAILIMPSPFRVTFFKIEPRLNMLAAIFINIPNTGTLLALTFAGLSMELWINYKHCFVCKITFRILN